MGMAARLGGGRQEAGRGHLLDVSAARHRPDRHQLRACRGSTWSSPSTAPAIVGEDGPTHHGMFDLAYTRMVPHMRVLAPSNEAELARALHTALALGGPFAIRYPRGTAEGVPVPDEPTCFEAGPRRTWCAKAMTWPSSRSGAWCRARLGRSRAAWQSAASHARVVDMRWVKPLGRCRPSHAAAAARSSWSPWRAASLAGGVGEGVLARAGAAMGQLPRRRSTMGIPRSSSSRKAKADLLLHDLGLDAQGIAAAIEERL